MVRGMLASTPHNSNEASFYWRSFFLYLEKERRYSQHTVSSYRQDLSQAQAFMRVRFTKDLVGVDYHMLRGWIMHLAEKNKASSINRKIACLRSFFKFLVLRNYVEKNPARLLTLLKTPHRLPVFVKEQEMQHLFAKCAFPEGFAGIRDKLVLSLLYGTGLRLSEVIALKVSQWHVEQTICSLKVMGKGNKERIVPFPLSLGEEIQHYLHARAAHFGSKVANKECLILSDKGEKTYPMMIHRLVKNTWAW